MLVVQDLTGLSASGTSIDNPEELILVSFTGRFRRNHNSKYAGVTIFYATEKLYHVHCNRIVIDYLCVFYNIRA